MSKERKERNDGARATRGAELERRDSRGAVVVEPRWLLRWGGVLLVVALVCGYATFCLLFYQGQWQLVLHPVRSTARPETIGGQPYQEVRFGPDGTGVPQRTGWWMPAAEGTQYRQIVVLYLPSGDGWLGEETATLDGLRRAGVSAFAVNYRGYGDSAAMHPSEARMREDANAAFDYLVNERKVPVNRVVPYGVGVGAVLALDLAQRHPAIPATVLDSVRFDVAKQVAHDARVRLLPVSLLLRDRFALEPALENSKTPKLIFTRAEEERRRVLAAGDPKITVAMPQFEPTIFDGSLRRFLNLYAGPTPAPGLLLPGEQPKPVR